MSTQDSVNESEDFVQVDLELTEEEYEMIKTLAEEKDLTISEFVNDVLEEYIKTFDIEEFKQQHAHLQESTGHDKK